MTKNRIKEILAGSVKFHMTIENGEGTLRMNLEGAADAIYNEIEDEIENEIEEMHTGTLDPPTLVSNPQE